MKFLSTLGLLGATATLSGCLGSDNILDNPEYNLVEAFALVDRFGSAAEVSPEDLPAEATMSGFVEVFSEEDNTDDSTFVVAGDMNMTADFSNSRITGGATNLAEYEVFGDCDSVSTCDAEFQQSFGGSLEIRSDEEDDGVEEAFGIIEGSSFRGWLDGSLTGSIEDEGAGSGTFVADVITDFNGSFRSDDQGLIAAADVDGSVTITPTIDGVEYESEVQSVSGGFVVAE
jgi:hypothetical protein